MYDRNSYIQVLTINLFVSVDCNLEHLSGAGGKVKTDRSEKTKRSVKAGRFFLWRSEIPGHSLHFT